MNKCLLIIILTLILTFLLTGCQTTPTAEIAQAQQKAESGDWSDCGKLGGEAEQSLCYQAASKTKEAVECAELPAQKSYICYQVVARVKKDTNICDNIPTTEQERIALDVNPPQMVSLRNLCYQGVAAEKKDITICESLGISKYSCYNSVAVMSKDPSICGKIPKEVNRPGYTDSLQASCYWFFAEYMPEAADCSEMPDDSIKDRCYANSVRDINNVNEINSLCSKIKEPEKKDECYDMAALNNDGNYKGIDTCGYILDKHKQKSCNHQLERYILSEEVSCENVESSFKNECLAIKAGCGADSYLFPDKSCGV